MSIFTLLLDASIINAFEVYNKMELGNADERMKPREFKRQVAEALFAPK